MLQCRTLRLRLVMFQLAFVTASICTLFSGNIYAQSINGPELNSNAYPSESKYWGQCTWYVRGRAKENDNVELPPYGKKGSGGDATDWAKGINSQTPQAHSIAVWQNATKGNGHVAYVEKVDDNGDIWITEANYFNFRDEAGDNIGGGFDGCHILKNNPKNNEMAKRGDLILKGYITYPITAPPAPPALLHTCTHGKALSIDRNQVFSPVQSGDQVTITFKGAGFVQGPKGAKVIAQGTGWTSDQALVVSNTGKELVAVLGVQDAATFTVAIQNPDMERSKPQTLTVAAAPPIQVSNPQPVPAQEPASTPAIAPDVPDSAGALLIPPGPPPVPEVTTPAATPEVAAPAEQPAAPQPLTIPQAQQPIDDSSPAPSPDQSADSQPASQPAAPSIPDQASIPSTEQPASETPAPRSAAAVSMAPALLRVSPGRHAPGQFTVDLWGFNFQSGAKIIAQGNGWWSDQAAVTFLDSTHLQATIVAQNPAQFTIVVQNPHAQTSSAQSFLVTQLQTSQPGNPLVPSSTPTAPANTPAPDPSTSQLIAPTIVPANSANAAPSPAAGPTNSPAPNSNAGSTVTIAPRAPVGKPGATAGVLSQNSTSNRASTTSTASGSQRKIPIPTINGWSSSDHQEVVNARWQGQPPQAGRHGNYYLDYAIDSSPGLSFWTFSGSGFGVKQGSIAFSDSAIQGIIRSWSDTQIRVDLKVPYTYTSNKNVTVTLTAADGVNVSMVVPVVGAISTRGYGQCTWYVANQLLSHNLAIPMGAYQATGPINSQYIPQQWDVVDFNNPHTAIILTQPTQAKVANPDGTETITYSFTIGEMNADWGERESTTPSKFIVKVDKNGNRTEVQGITSGVKKTATSYFSLLPRSVPATTVGSAPPSTSLPVLRATGTSFKAGDTTDLVGENFTRNSRVSLLLTAPGAPETFLVSFTSDPNGGFHYPFSAACDAKSGPYSIRALDQTPAGSGISGRKSNSLALTVAGKETHCLLGIKTAVASGAPASGPPPVLNPVTPASHPAGQFSIDLNGSGFQPGAKVLVQAANGQSSQASVTYFGSDHLRAIINAPNPAQFTMTVQNPDSQMSTAHPFQVTQATAFSTKSAQVPAVANTPRGPVSVLSTPVSAPANAGSTVPSARSTNIPGPSVPVSAPTPARQHVIVNSTPVQPRPVSPVVSAPQIKPMPAPQSIRPMFIPQPNAASYPPSTNTTKPILHPPSQTNSVTTPPQMPVSTIPTAPGIKPAIPAPAVTTVRPPPTQIVPARPTPVPMFKAQPQPATPPVRVATTPLPAARVYTPPPRVIPQPTPLPMPARVAPTPMPVQRVYTPPPPPRAVAQPTLVPQPTKTPTPKKP